MLKEGSTALPWSGSTSVASGLAACTYAILASWGERADLRADDLALEVSWTFADKPHRVGRFDLRFEWPSLPAARLEAARRVAAQCPVHVTLERPPELTITGSAAPAGAAAAPELAAV